MKYIKPEIHITNIESTDFMDTTSLPILESKDDNFIEDESEILTNNSIWDE